MLWEEVEMKLPCAMGERNRQNGRSGATPRDHEEVWAGFSKGLYLDLWSYHMHSWSGLWPMLPPSRCQFSGMLPETMLMSGVELMLGVEHTYLSGQHCHLRPS